MTRFIQPGGGRPAGTFTGWARKLLDGVSVVWLRPDDFDVMLPGEVAQLANDFGMTAAELRATARGNPRNVRFMQCMLEALNIDPTALRAREPGAYQDMERVCGMCTNTRRCSRELDTGRARSTYSSYCLNATTLDALRKECG